MDYKNIKINPKMNETVKDMLKLNDDNCSLYALKRIEELEQLILSGVSHRRELFDNFYKWLDDLTQEEYDDMSLTDKIEKYFFKNQHIVA